MKARTFLKLIPIAGALASALSGCITRTEIEAYTVVDRDTSITEHVANAPGERDNGVVFPTSRFSAMEHPVRYHDSTHYRYYPDFLRAGGLELAGFIGTGGASNSYSGGFLGAYGLLDRDVGVQNKSHTFTGGLVRINPYETRLRWFRDAPNWTLGTSLAEFFIPEMDANKVVYSIYPIYFRKRFFLRDQAPYIMAQPTIGIGLLPWQYVNIGGTIDVGSYGGLNFHAYLGYIAGERLQALGFGDSVNRSAGFPYFGLGVSVLDFVNTVEETEHEWKEYKHHAIDIQAIGFDVVHSLAGTKSYFDTTSSSFPTGLAIRFATMDYPLWGIDKHIFAGTTLFTIAILGQEVGGMSVLPIRAGYFMTVIADELTNKAYLEYNYYPASFMHVADKLTLDVSSILGLSVNLTLGWMNGNAGFVVDNSFQSRDKGFSGAYIAIGAGLSDHIFGLDKLTPW